LGKISINKVLGCAIIGAKEEAITMKGFFSRIWKSCFNPSSYTEIKDQSFGKSLGYITLLILLYVTIFSFFINLFGFNFVGQATKWIDSNVPEVTIKDGAISADVEQPYVRDLDGFAFIIDTTGKIEEIGDEYESGILATKDQVFFKRSEHRTEVYDVPVGEDEFIIDAGLINMVLNIGKYFIFPIVLIGVFAFYWIAVFIKIFFYSLISMAINAIFSAKLKYGELLNIGVHAVTLPFLLSIIVELLGIPISGWIYNHLIYVIMLAIVINKIQKA
jgi:hypothetical protein